MPRLEELINEKSKKKLNTMKNNSDLIKGKVISDGSSNFVGATPNLNSSLGVNAADGDPATTTTTDQSKLNQLYTQNKDIISGTLDRLLGSSNTTYNPSTGTGGNIPPATKSSGMAWWIWVIIAIVVLLIGFFVFKAVKK